MDTDYEREQQEQKEDQRRLEEVAAERRAEMAPAPAPLRTPREEVSAYIRLAVEALRGPQPILATAVRWLDQAREVVDSPNVVDGAALLRTRVEEARDAAGEGEFGQTMIRLDEVLELLRRQVRYPEVEIPRDDGDFVRDDGRQQRKRDAVRAVLLRHRLELMTALQTARAEVLDEIVAAAETGI